MPPSPSPPRGRPRRRARERVARRSEILAAARAVFGRKGFRSATLDEIASRAEFAKGTLYNYFRNKEDLFHEVLDALLHDMQAIAESVHTRRGSARETLREFAFRLMEYYKANEDFLRIIAVELNRVQCEEPPAGIRALLARFGRIAGILGDILQRDCPRRRLLADPADLAQVFLALIHNRSMRRSFEGKGLRAMQSDHEAAFLTQLFFDGITCT